MTVPYWRSVTTICAEFPEVDLLVVEGESNINRARNNLAATFLQSGHQTLAMIDSDIEMSPEDFLALVNLVAPIRGAAVATKTKDGSESLSCWWQDGRHTRQYKRGEDFFEPFVCKYLGSAVMLIEREVIQRFYKERKRRYTDDVLGKCTSIFECRVVDDVYLTEDYGFCHDARKLGFKIMCDPRVIVKHYGQSVWKY